MTEEITGFKTIKDLPTGDFREKMKLTKKYFVVDLVRYLKTHPRYEEMTKEETAAAAVEVLLGDIGAANDFLKLIGVDVDLYNQDLGANTVLISGGVVRKEVPYAELTFGSELFAIYSKATLIEWGFDPTRAIIYWGEPKNNRWVLVQEKKEVIDGDRTEGTSAGGDPSPDQWEDFVRWRRLRKDGDNPGVLRTEGDT